MQRSWWTSIVSRILHQIWNCTRVTGLQGVPHKEMKSLRHARSVRASFTNNIFKHLEIAHYKNQKSQKQNKQILSDLNPLMLWLGYCEIWASLWIGCLLQLILNLTCIGGCWCDTFLTSITDGNCSRHFCSPLTFCDSVNDCKMEQFKQLLFHNFLHLHIIFHVLASSFSSSLLQEVFLLYILIKLYILL